ncbi:MAG TPA: PilX N-terminal domain-containing pilus assembly protein [Vicinamibacterales bacterium]
MNDTPPSDAQRQDERGMALVGVLLLLLMMSALGAALTVNAETETLIARNQLSATQAQAAAEAGLNHGVEVATEYIFDWKSNGFASVEAAVDGVLINADAGNLNGLALNTNLTISADFDAEYQVAIMDDDDDGFGEDGDPLNDVNDVLVVRSTGFARDGTKVVLEARISPQDLGAIVTNGNLTLSGNASIEGAAGSVHSNGDLTIDGNSVSVEDNVSSTGELDCDDPCNQVGGTATEGAAEVPVPPVHASDYLVWADYVLKSDGTMTQGGSVVCTWDSKTSCNNWDWDSSSGTWSLTSNSVTAGTYYVEGHATVSGSPGSTKNPAQISIIAEGSIEISGSPKLAPDTPELLFVTDQDLKITGTIDSVGEATLVQGQMLVRGQASILGNASLDGQLLIEDQAVGDLVASNVVGGSVVITYAGGLGGSVYTVTSWRDVRDAD